MAMATPLALGMTVLGGVASGLGQASSSSAQQQMYTYQAGLSAQNATIQQQNAQYALMQGEQQAAQSGMKTRLQEGQIKAGQGASGLNVNTGTAVNVRQSQQEIGQTDQTAIRSSAAKRAYDYDVSAVQATDQAAAYTASAKNVAAAEPLQIASSILGTGASVATKWQSDVASGALSSGSWGF